MPIGDCARENALGVASGMNFDACQPAHGKPGAWRKSASASSVRTKACQGARLLRAGNSRADNTPLWTFLWTGD
jgi:hypothetical protein